MQRINQCLNSQLELLCKQTIEYERIQSKLTQYLPENLQDKVTVGSFSKGILVLTVCDAVWATTLRYLIPELRDALRQKEKLHQLSSITIQVKTTTTFKALQSPAKRVVSDETRTTLKQALLSLAKD